jgi:hypothetical protein
MRSAVKPLAVGAVLLAVFIGAGMANERGDALGLIAIPVYAGIFISGIFWRAWLREHPLVDRAFAAPIFFFAFAFLTNLSLAVCAALGVTAAIALAVVAQRRGPAPG